MPKSDRTDTIRRVKKAAFLAAFVTEGTVLHAANVAGIDRSTHYDWLTTDPAYARAFAEAEDKAIEMLEREARRRAIEGTEKPVFYRDEVVGHIREYSDTLLIFLMKAARPSKYRERVDINLDVRHAIDALTTDPEERAAALAEVERILAVSR